MKKAYIFLLFSLITVHAYSQSNTVEPDVKAAIVTFYDGISSLKDADIQAAVTNDFTLIEDKKIWNTDSLLKVLQPMKNRDIKRINKQEFTKIEQNGNVVWTIYYNTAFLTMGDKSRTIKWLESALLLKEAGKWKIKLLHVTDL